MLKEIVVTGAVFIAGATAIMAHPGGREAHRRAGTQRLLYAVGEKLELSDAQRTEIRALRETNRAQRMERREEMKRVAVEYRNLRNRGDEAAAARALANLRQLREEAFALRLAARDDFERILTPEQREKIEEWRRDRRR